MKVLQVVHAFGPASHGGTETYVRALSEQLGLQGHDVAILAGSAEGRDHGEVELGEVEGIPTYTLYRPGLYVDSWYHRYSPSAEILFGNVLKDFAPDVVHIHQWMRLSSNLVQIAHEHGIPATVTLHDTGMSCPRVFRVRTGSHCNLELAADNCFDCAERNWFQEDDEMRAAVRAFHESSVTELTLASQIMALSETHKQAMEGFMPCLEGRIQVVPPPRLGSPLSSEASSSGADDGHVRLVYWGALTSMKGLHLLLEAMRGLGPQQSVALDIWGSFSSAEDSYADQIERLSVGLDVTQHGDFSPEEISAKYDLAVFPAICRESYGITVDEAWERGIPVIVPSHGAPVQRLDGRGDTFKPGDAKDLTRVLKRICRDRSVLQTWRVAIQGAEAGASGFEDVLRIYDAAIADDGGNQSLDVESIRNRAADLARRLNSRDRALWEMRGLADSARSEADGLAREVELREEVIEQREEDLSEFEASLDATRELALRRQRDVESLESEIVSLREELLDYEEALTESREVATRQNRHLRSDAKRAADLASHLEGSGEALEEKNRLLGEYETALKAREEELKLLQGNLTDAQLENVGESSAALAELRERLESVQADHSQELVSREKELDDVKAAALENERAMSGLRTELEKVSQSHETKMEALNMRASHAEGEASSSREMQLLEEAARKEIEAVLTVVETELSTARQNFEDEIIRLRRKLVDMERRSIRSEVLGANIGDEQQTSRQFIELQEEALNEALVECQRLGAASGAQEKVMERLRETLVPIAREANPDFASSASSEQIIAGAVANHTRLHGIIAERGILIGALEERLGQVSEREDFALEAPSSETSRRLIERVRASAAVRESKDKAPDRLRILFVVHDFLPKHAAGTEIYTYNLAQQLNERHDIHLMFCEARHEQERYTVSKGTIDGLPYTEIVHNYEWQSFEETYHDPRMESIFAGVLEEIRPDIVHIQHLHYFSLNFPAMAKAAGAAVVYTLHEFLLLCPRGGQLLRENMEICEEPKPELCAECVSHNRLAANHGQEETSRKRQRIKQLLPKSVVESYERFTGPIVPGRLSDTWRAAFASAVTTRLEFIKKALKQVDLFISPSAFLRQKFIDCEMIEEDRIIHSDNGFELDLFDGVEHVNSDVLRFGFVGTIADYKGLHVLVEAFNAIEAERVELQIWGDLDTFEDYKQRLVGSIDSPLIRTMGRFDNKRIAHVLSEIDVLIVPSLWFENSPLTIHEAWLARIPVIASDIGGMAELVDDGVNGFHFRTGDEADLREKVMRFVDDRTLASKLSQAPGVVKEIGENAVELEGIYRRLMMEDGPS